MRCLDRIVAAVPLLSALICAGAIPASAQSAAKPTIQGAFGRLNSGDTVGALAMIRAVVAADSLSPPAWSAYGTLAQRTRRWDDARIAWNTALRLDRSASRGNAMIGLGTYYAARGERDSAFAWLGRAHDTHQVDMSAITNDSLLEPLRSDPRYHALLPVPADFAHPFVEAVHLVREFDGEAANDQFGWIARGIGDVDHDGISDFVTSAPTHGADNSNAGKVYLYSTGTGKLLWSVDGAPGGQLGLGIEGAGDANHDGTPDVVASAPYLAQACIYSGRDGSVLQTLASPGHGEAFGMHVAGAGDVDSDGYADVVIGSPALRAGNGPGHAYVFSGRDGHLLLTLAGEADGDAFGQAVSGGGDRIHHSIIVVGAARGGLAHTGRSYVYYDGATTPAFVTDADSTGVAYGAMFLSIPGDMDGDGVADIFESDWNNSARGPSTGRVYVHSGATGKLIRTLTGENAGDGFGTSASDAGDVDGDGRADLIVGAWQYSGAAASAGKAYLYSGATGKLLRSYTGSTPGDTFGFDAVGIGDADHDGTVDLLITSAYSGVHGFHSGRVLVISSGITKEMSR